jgi:uncharacterized DUF497 family protein
MRRISQQRHSAANWPRRQSPHIGARIWPGLVHNRTRWRTSNDRRKEASNVRKHGIRFADAVSVLEDDRAITVSDDSIDEERWVTIGMDALGRVLVVVYAWRDEKIRIISARRATARESRQYPENL